MAYVLNKWMDIHQTEWLYHCDRFKTFSGFGDFDPIFKVIVLYVGYLLNQLMDFLLT